ncbi:MAG: transposase [Candidatus Freyarchaeota archaeon]
MILSKKEEAEIRKFMQETRSKGEYRRAEAVLYKAEGLSYRAIAKKMNAAYLSVYRWIQRYKKGGANALRTKTYPGKKPRNPRTEGKP